MTYQKVKEVDILPSDKIVNIHIPKTAGTTFNSILDSTLWGFTHYPEWYLNKVEDLDLEQVRQFQFFTGHFSHSLFSDYLFPEGFVGITFLRNPINRTLSYFKFIHQQFKQNKLINHITESNMDEEKEKVLADLCLAILMHYDSSQKESLLAFSQFLKKINYGISRNVVNLQTKIMGLHLQKKVIDINLSTLETAKNNLQNLAFFGITERFQESLFLLSYVFGWQPMENKLHLNVTSKPKVTNKLPTELISELKKQIEFDLDLYKFGGNLFDLRFREITETLLKDYGEKEHANITYPLSTDVMMNLLEKHYLYRREKRLKSTHYSLPAFVEYNPSMIMERPFGWYSLETSPDYGHYRWSGPETSSGFDLPCPAGKNISFSFCLLTAIQKNILDELSLSINDTLVEIKYTKDEQGRFIFSGKIPEQAISDSFLRLCFSIPKTISPNQINPNNTDTRLLGIALNWVKLYPENT